MDELDRIGPEPKWAGVYQYGIRIDGVQLYDFTDDGEKKTPKKVKKTKKKGGRS